MKTKNIQEKANRDNAEQKSEEEADNSTQQNYQNLESRIYANVKQLVESMFSNDNAGRFFVLE